MFRSLRSRPQFTIFALGLGIGANCELFTVLDSFLLRPLPYPNVHEVVEISRNFLVRGGQDRREPTDCA